ncbi:hypothetical protein PCCS19_15610 [Paenibacillus sp. CCS19]|uniref:Hcp family type VI secretion system effector n=1 Tax=Paenibacillus sp. CCS19 TaxID=3158387 RepID=UPI00256E71F1|nr:type VI secretion system tube protein Hcp [Paenibacillus cellulosilyticus]GMK38507.1 hypothetical protein PCCS19_15610 [Paenibacillus cellulosilyticus]
MFNRSRIKVVLIMLSIVSLVCAWPMAASAAGTVNHHSILLKLDGIKGESKDANKLYQDAIEINSYSFGLTVPFNVSKGSGANTAKPEYSDIQLTKYLDTASISLLQTAAAGKAIKSGTLYFFKNGQDKPYLTIQLSNIYVTSQEQYVEDDGDPMEETITLSALEMSFTYTLIGADGRETNQTVTIDRVKNQVK